MACPSGYYVTLVIWGSLVARVQTSQEQAFVSLSKKFYIHWSVLVGSRNWDYCLVWVCHNVKFYSCIILVYIGLLKPNIEKQILKVYKVISESLIKCKIMNSFVLLSTLNNLIWIIKLYIYISVKNVWKLLCCTMLYSDCVQQSCTINWICSIC